MDLEKVIRKQWEKLEAQVGPMGYEDKAKVEELVGGEPVLNDPEYVECFTLAIDNLLAAHTIFKRIERGGTVNESAKVKNVGVKATQIAEQRLWRRATIAAFVVFQTYHLLEVWLPLMMNDPLPNRRIPWKELLMEWNKKYPKDIMSSTDTFRTTFYRILREPDILVQMIVIYMAGDESFLQKVKKSVDAFRAIDQSKEGQRALQSALTAKRKRARRVFTFHYRLYEELNKWEVIK
ncbi:hypothetical protein ACFLV0_00765 [Chloroflexota bacterium]